MRAIAIGAISITILVLASTVAVRLASGQADSVCVTGTAVATSTPSLIVDCEILLEIKPALRGTAQLNWWTGRSIEQWDGIIVQSGRVAEVSLANRDLNGVIPAGFGRSVGSENAGPEFQRPDRDDSFRTGQSFKPGVSVDLL